MTISPSWLETDWILAAFVKRKSNAQIAYRHFVSQGKNQRSPWKDLKNQIYLGSETFVERMHRKMGANQHLDEIPKTQRRPVAQPLDRYFKKHKDRNTAIFEAYRSGGYSMEAVGDYVGLHYSRISRIVSSAEKAKNKT